MATITMPSSGGCGPVACDDPRALERTRFYRRQVVSPDDLTQDQRHFLDKHRRHNRLMHGWGVVCGAGVTQALGAGGAPEPFTVSVAPGYALGPQGDEILVDRTVTFDVRRLADDADGGCPPPPDAWCPPVRVDRDPRQTIHLAVRHAEQEARPVQVGSGCGCGPDCEYSRIVDGFALGILERLPNAYVDDPNADPKADRGRLFQQTAFCTAAVRASGRPCPPCPASPWIVLADITAARDGTLTIDQWAHRRLVAAYGPYGFYCTPSGPPPPPAPPPTAPPPQLVKVWPPAKKLSTWGETSAEAASFFARPRLELTLSRPIADAAAKDVDGWLRAFRAARDVDVINRFDRLGLRFAGSAVDAAGAVTITVEFTDRDEFYRHGLVTEVLVVVRPDAAPAGQRPVGAEPPNELLDADFAGSTLDAQAVRTIFAGGAVAPLPSIGSATTEGATLHDGAPGGLVHYVFSLEQVIG